MSFDVAKLPRSIALALSFALAAASPPARAEQASSRVEALLARMTLEEKVGQLNLVSGHHAVTGPYTRSDVKEAILTGQAGGLFHLHGDEDTRGPPDMAGKKNRPSIPPLTRVEVGHGYRTLLPFPPRQAPRSGIGADEGGEAVPPRGASAGVTTGAALAWYRRCRPRLGDQSSPRGGRLSWPRWSSAFWRSRARAARARSFGCFGAPVYSISRGS
ncbi:hypothetical protein WDZ92_45120, partial [Nostoc sp. NIES-2111]